MRPLKCDSRDQDLLLMLHGELPWMRKVLTNLHLAQCDICQHRAARLDEVSALFGAALGGNRYVRPQLSRRAGWSGRGKLVLVLAALLAIGVSVAVIMQFFGPTPDGGPAHIAEPAKKGGLKPPSPMPVGPRMKPSSDVGATTIKPCDGSTAA